MMKFKMYLKKRTSESKQFIPFCPMSISCCFTLSILIDHVIKVYDSDHFQTEVHGNRSVLCIVLGKNTSFGLMYLNKALEASLIVLPMS